jgi:hypothetical protein|tara:strand:- start:1302 stop:1478 length:177 start_codon:yes stop_codon:yes gene_type:complete
VDGITIAAERSKIADFFDGYIATEQRMLVRLGEDRFSRPSSHHAPNTANGCDSACIEA